ncbi:MAG: SDR family oxidoreductase [Clostridiales Family XIII bacterium]|nr:SDR family oxidoreductase [Clostridiales Family XIII bacterium]
MKGLEIFSLEGKVGYITGAGQGIGKELAKAIAAAGAKIAVIDINEETAQTVTAEIRESGGEAIAIHTDVTDEAACVAMVKTLTDQYGRLDFGINNAGGGNELPVLEMSKEDFMKVIDLNIAGVFLPSKAAAAYMKDHGGGSIVNTASMSSYIVNTPQTITAYNTSKAGCRHLTKSCAVEWAKYGIRVNSVSPGYMMTELTKRISHMHPLWLPLIPLGRIGDPKELVGAFVYLISEASAYATGTDILVDGGYTCL